MDRGYTVSDKPSMVENIKEEDEEPTVGVVEKMESEDCSIAKPVVMVTFNEATQTPWYMNKVEDEAATAHVSMKNVHNKPCLSVKSFYDI